MSRSTRHAYEVVEIDDPKNQLEGRITVGQTLVDKNHVRKEHEPYRDWTLFRFTDASEALVVGKHIGEYEKVKHLLVAKATA